MICLKIGFGFLIASIVILFIPLIFNFYNEILINSCLAAFGIGVVFCLTGAVGIISCYPEDKNDKNENKEQTIIICDENDEVLIKYEDVQTVTYHQKDGSLSFVGEDGITYSAYPVK